MLFLNENSVNTSFNVLAALAKQTETKIKISLKPDAGKYIPHAILTIAIRSLRYILGLS